MVKLTIKGNKTRGKEVIEILKHILMKFLKKILVQCTTKFFLNKNIKQNLNEL